jgi:acetoin utilization protein AcuB
VMVPAPATAPPDMPVGAAHSLLREHRTQHLLVLDQGLLVGIVSQRDLLRAQSDALPVRDVMQHLLFVLAPGTPVSRAARIFRDRRVPVLPVLDGRDLVGVVRAVDVLETAWDRAKS